jgi:hypothetical protein
MFFQIKTFTPYLELITLIQTTVQHYKMTFRRFLLNSAMFYFRFVHEKEKYCFSQNDLNSKLFFT